MNAITPRKVIEGELKDLAVYFGPATSQDSSGRKLPVDDSVEKVPGGWLINEGLWRDSHHSGLVPKVEVLKGGYGAFFYTDFRDGFVPSPHLLNTMAMHMYEAVTGELPRKLLYGPVVWFQGTDGDYEALKGKMLALVERTQLPEEPHGGHLRADGIETAILFDGLTFKEVDARPYIDVRVHEGEEQWKASDDRTAASELLDGPVGSVQLRALGVLLVIDVEELTEAERDARDPSPFGGALAYYAEEHGERRGGSGKVLGPKSLWLTTLDKKSRSGIIQDLLMPLLEVQFWLERYAERRLEQLN